MIEHDGRATDPSELRGRVEIGIRHCREGNWELGLDRLGRIAEAIDNPDRLPGAFYSFLGHGLAREQSRVDEGVRLCRKAIEVEFYNPENYLNLARTFMLRGSRREAIEAVRNGLAVDAESPELNSLIAELGIRRSPVLRFLGRSSFVNRILGRLRHDFGGPVASLGS